MGLDLTPKGLCVMVGHAEKLRDKYLEGFDDDLARYTGPYWKSSFGIKEPENHIFEWFSLMLPQLVTGNPRFRLTTTRSALTDTVRAYQYALNNWAQVTDMRAVNEKCAVNFGLRWCISFATTEIRPGYRERSDPVYWPQLKAIDPRWFIWDPAGMEPEIWRFQGHKVVRDIDEIEDEANDDPDSGWNLEAIRALKDNTPTPSRPHLKNSSVEDRNELVYYDIWVPEYTEDGWAKKGFTEEKGYHGAWLTYAHGDQGGYEYVRNPRPAFVPASGPYTIGGCYSVAGEPVPLSYASATRAQAEYLNRVANSIIDSAEAYKRLAFVDGSDPKVVDAIKNSPHDYIHALNPGSETVRAQVSTVELGGIPNALMTAKLDARATLDRVGGMSDAQRGNVTGEATATENQIAGYAATMRTGFLVTKFTKFITDSARKILHYMEMDSDVVMELGEEANGQFMDPITGRPMQSVMIRGGVGKNEEPMADRLDMDVEYGSTARNTEAQRQYQMAQVDQAVQTLLLAPQAPYINWQGYMDMKSEMSGVPQIRELVDFNLLREWTGLVLQMGQAAPAAQPSTSKPRLTTDLLAAPTTGGGGAQPAAKKRPEMTPPPTKKQHREYGQ